MSSKAFTRAVARVVTDLASVAWGAVTSALDKGSPVKRGIAYAGIADGTRDPSRTFTVTDLLAYMVKYGGPILAAYAAEGPSVAAYFTRTDKATGAVTLSPWASGAALTLAEDGSVRGTVEQFGNALVRNIPCNAANVRGMLVDISIRASKRGITVAFADPTTTNGVIRAYADGDTLASEGWQGATFALPKA
jgi:hypothetical protein